MKKNTAVFCSLLLALLLAACGLNLPTKSAGEETTKAPRTSAAASDADTLPAETDPQPGPAKPDALLPGLKEDYDPADLLQNNLSCTTTAGRIVHAYGGTWFVQKGLENDGRENGFEYSENIYFLSDEPGAEPVLVGFVPSDATDNIQQLTVFYLTPGPQTPEGRFLYFSVSAGSSGRLFRIDLATGKAEDLNVLLSQRWGVGNASFFRTEDKLYFVKLDFMPEQSGYPFHTERMVLDLKTGQMESADLAIPTAKGEMAQIIGMSGGFLYYAKSPSDYFEPYGFFRMRPDGGGEEEVAPIPCEEIDFALCTDSYLIYGDDDNDETVFLSAESGKEVLRLSDDAFDFRDAPFTVSGDTLLYFEGGNLMNLNIPTGRTETMIAGKDREIILITHTEDEIWFMDDDDYGTYKVSKTGRILPASPVVPTIDREDYDRGEAAAEGDWLYYEYPNCVRLSGYTGSDAELTLPLTLAGKPVTIVRLDLRDNESVRKVIIPEGIISLLGFSGGENLKELLLPESLEQMVVRGYDYTLYLPADAEIRYAGTMAQWDALCERNAALHDVAVASQKNPVDDVICSDGVWIRPD